MVAYYKDQVECPGQGHPDLNYFFLSNYGEAGEREEALRHIEKCVHCLNLLAAYAKRADASMAFLEFLEKFFPDLLPETPPMSAKVRGMIADLRRRKLQ